MVNPPPEAAHRVDGGGPWGPTQFDLPDRGGRDTRTVLVVILIGVVVLLIIAALWVLAYYRFT